MDTCNNPGCAYQESTQKPLTNQTTQTYYCLKCNQTREGASCWWCDAAQKGSMATQFVESQDVQQCPTEGCNCEPPNTDCHCPSCCTCQDTPHDAVPKWEDTVEKVTASATKESVAERELLTWNDILLTDIEMTERPEWWKGQWPVHNIAASCKYQCIHEVIAEAQARKLLVLIKERWLGNYASSNWSAKGEVDELMESQRLPEPVNVPEIRNGMLEYLTTHTKQELLDLLKEYQA